MKKVILIISSVVLLAVVVGGFGLYIVNTPEYAPKSIMEDVNNSGIEGLKPHLTGIGITSSHIIDELNFIRRVLIGMVARSAGKLA